MKMLMRTFQSEDDFGFYTIGSIDISPLLNNLKSEGVDTPKVRELLFTIMFEAAEAEVVKGLPAAMKVEMMGDTVFNGAKGRLYNF